MLMTACMSVFRPKKSKTKIFVRPGFWVLFMVYSLFIQCEFSLQMEKGGCETQVGWRVWDPQEMVCPAIPTAALQKRRPGMARS